jgi:hypothetical protein
LSEATRNAGASVIRAKIPGLNSAISKCRGPNATWPKIRQQQRDYRPSDPHNPAELSGSHKNVDEKNTSFGPQLDPRMDDAGIGKPAYSLFSIPVRFPFPNINPRHAEIPPRRHR